MKMEIECRKLRIGLRSCNSFGYLPEYRKKRTNFSEKMNFLKSTKNFFTHEKVLGEEIAKEKRKMNELGTR